MIEKTKKVQLHVPEWLQIQIKLQATYHNMTIKKYILQAVIERMKRDREVQ
jgi:hypothetical protein